MEVILTIAIVALASVVIFRLNRLVSNVDVRISHDSYLNNHGKYQIALFLLALVVLIVVYLQDPQNFKLLFSVGDVTAPVEPVKWFGIGENKTWLYAGLYLSIIITLGTLSFVYMQFRKLNIEYRELLPYALWILVFSLMNSFSEEAIYRLGVISPLYGEVGAEKLVLLSAVIFGVVHFGGMPYGLVGMLMAGFLGWFLAKSVLETQGIFWAWSIHFIQDVVIYIGFMVGHISSCRAVKSG